MIDYLERYCRDTGYPGHPDYLKEYCSPAGRIFWLIFYRLTGLVGFNGWHYLKHPIWTFKNVAHGICVRIRRRF